MTRKLVKKKLDGEKQSEGYTWVSRIYARQIYNPIFANLYGIDVIGGSSKRVRGRSQRGDAYSREGGASHLLLLLLMMMMMMILLHLCLVAVAG